MSFALSDKHIVVNYHYVEDSRTDRAGIHSCSCDDFERQIKFLSQNYRITSISEVYEAAQSKSNECLCAITFDDGLKDQHENAIPILKKYKIPATFFIITGTLEGVVPVAHKIHILLSLFSGDELVIKSNSFLTEHHFDIVEKYYIPTDRRLTNTRALFDTDIAVVNFKETMTILPENIKNDLLNWLCCEKKDEIKNMTDSLFMSKEDIKDLHKSGFWIGNHTHNHYALDTQDEKTVRNEISLSAECLKQLTGTSTPLFCYPLGSANDMIRLILKEAGIEYATTTEQRAVSKDDMALLIPRYDTNDIQIA